MVYRGVGATEFQIGDTFTYAFQDHRNTWAVVCQIPNNAAYQWLKELVRIDREYTGFEYEHSGELTAFCDNKSLIRDLQNYNEEELGNYLLNKLAIVIHDNLALYKHDYRFYLLKRR